MPDPATKSEILIMYGEDLRMVIDEIYELALQNMSYLFNPSSLI